MSSGTTLRMTRSGTLVGLPVVRPAKDQELTPIVPCEDPEDDGDTMVDEPWRRMWAPEPEPPLPLVPKRRSMPEEERRLLARAALIAAFAVGFLIVLVLLGR